MSQSARSDYNVGINNSDGYKPTSVPNALSVINGQIKNSMEVVKMANSKVVAPVKPMLKSVSCLYIPSTDPDMLHEWFNRVFGLNQNGWTKLSNGLSLIFVKSESRGRLSFEGEWDSKSDFKMHVLAFEVDNVTELHQSLIEQGVEVTDIRDNGGCGIEFDFTDPEGNRYCAWEMQTEIFLNDQGDVLFGNCNFAQALNVDEFLKILRENTDGPSKLLKVSGDSLNHHKYSEVLKKIEQIGANDPDKAFRIVHSG